MRRDVMPAIVAPLAAEQAPVGIRSRDGFGAVLEEPTALVAAPIAFLTACHSNYRAMQLRPSGWVDFDQGRHGAILRLPEWSESLNKTLDSDKW
jgi:hypothetical protein